MRLINKRIIKRFYLPSTLFFFKVVREVPGESSSVKSIDLFGVLELIIIQFY